MKKIPYNTVELSEARLSIRHTKSLYIMGRCVKTSAYGFENQVYLVDGISLMSDFNKV